MFDTSILEKVPTYTPNSSELSNSTDTIPPTKHDLYTIAQEEGDAPALLFKTSPKTLDGMWDRAKAVADLKIPVPWVISRVAGAHESVAVPSYDYVLGLLREQAFNDPIALIHPTGEIKVTRLYDYYRLCTRPWRVSGGCEECMKTNNAEFNGDSCLFELGLKLEKEESDFEATELRERIEALKHPRIGSSTWISPIYTKPDRIPVKRERWRYHRVDAEISGAFAPYLRSVQDHDFSNIEECQNRQSQAAKTRAKINDLKKNVCARCSYKTYCDNYYKWSSNHHVLHCTCFNDSPREKLIAQYSKLFKGIPRKTLAFVLKNCGELPWRYGVHKVVLKVDYRRYNGFQVTLRSKTHGYNTLHTFPSFEDAEIYLRSYDDRRHLIRYPEKPLSNFVLALYAIALQIDHSPTRGQGWHKTEYPICYTRANDNYVRVHFRYKSGDGPIYWSLDYTDIYEGFKYYGKQYRI
jgi:hypothetical protein